MQNKKSRFNWKLLLYGIPGLVILFILYLIGSIIFALAAAIGAIIGAALGLSLKDKVKIGYLAYACVAFFVILYVALFANYRIIEFVTINDNEFVILGAIFYALVGATLGLTLAYLIKKEHKVKGNPSKPLLEEHQAKV